MKHLPILKLAYEKKKKSNMLLVSFLILAIFALSACNGDAMNKCQETHTYETCVYTLR